MKTSVEKYFDKVASSYDYYKNKNSFYYKNLKKLLGSLIPKNKKVFEIGCGTGDLLASLSPKSGYGVDISGQMVNLAKSKHELHKNLRFSSKWPGESFDYIFMSDVIEHLEKPRETFDKISKLMDKNTIFINTMANPLWEPILMIGEKLKFKMPEGPHKRLDFKSIEKIVNRCSLKIISHDYKLLIPIEIPLVTSFINKYFEKPLRRLAFIEYFVAVKS